MNTCKRHLWIAAISLVLVACGISNPDANEDRRKYRDQYDFCPTVSKPLIAACTKAGGSLEKQGKAQCYICTITYSDAGKVCTGSADCQGNCYNYQDPVPVNQPKQTGTCAKNNTTFGCHQAIENSVASGPMLCID